MNAPPTKTETLLMALATGACMELGRRVGEWLADKLVPKKAEPSTPPAPSATVGK